MSYDPQIAGAIAVPGLAAIATRFTIDTGAGGTVITSPLVDAHHLLDHVGRVMPSPSHGVGGGESSDVVGRVDEVALGPFALHEPVVALSRDTQGSLANPSLGVNLGGNLLRRFVVTIDYPRRRVMLAPGAHYAEPFLADASGLVLGAEASDFRTFVVRAIVPGSAAADAQLEPGDGIVAIDGKLARDFALWEVVELFMHAGWHVALEITRGEREFTCVLALRALI
jgi:hypothetical protein